MSPDPPADGPRSDVPGHPAPGEPSVVDPSLSALVDTARANLAWRLGVDVDAVVVLSAEVVTWPDAGLGCRRPGMRYAQVPVDGARIVLSHAGLRYAYHVGGRLTVPFLCEHPG